MDEITDMVQRIYGKKGLSHDLRLIIKKMDKNKDGKIDKKEFVSTVDKFPALLFPAHHMQTTFREHCAGEKFWVEKTLQASTIRKMPEVMALFENHGGKMAQRKRETKAKVVEKSDRKGMKKSKVAADYDGVDLGAEMNEQQIRREHAAANKHIEKKGGNKINDEDEAARVIQCAQIRKKNKKKREEKKKKKAKMIDDSLMY